MSSLMRWHVVPMSWCARDAFHGRWIRSGAFALAASLAALHSRPSGPSAPASSASLRTMWSAPSAGFSFGASLPLALVLRPGYAPPRASVTLLNNSRSKLLTPWSLAMCSAVVARCVRSQIHRSATSVRTALELFEIEVPAERLSARPQGNLPINQ